MCIGKGWGKMGGSKRGDEDKGETVDWEREARPGNDDIVANQLGCEPFFFKEVIQMMGSWCR